MFSVWSVSQETTSSKHYKRPVITITSTEMSTKTNAILRNTMFTENNTRCQECLLFACYIYKVNQSRYTPWRRFGGEEYSSYSFTTSALYGGEWSASRPGRALPPEKRPPVPIVQEAGWVPEPVWTQRIE
jgi:hypothetical protein